ncbi:Fic family protein [Mycolicibacterium mucogenicum]|uniref:Fic family protein n=1 Tax=Mycolicibacterium mucogenicum TaxID=56689 RepID=UPI0010425183|nr:Fic family protein [Mycolicibacterium mucogenicum]
MTPDKHQAAKEAALLRVVNAAISSGEIEGWRPTREDAELLGQVARGNLAPVTAVDHLCSTFEAHFRLQSNDIGAIEFNWNMASWSDYVYAGTDVLVNRLNIRDGGQLGHLEGTLVAVRTIELLVGGASIPDGLDGSQLRGLHNHLAQDLYPWAGKYRSVPIGKKWSQFAPIDAIDACVARAAAIAAETDWPATSDDEFAEQAAAVYAWLNYAHPFRDLNGRTTRLFMDEVAAQANREFNYGKISSDIWIQRSAFTVPDREQTGPQSKFMIPVFAVIARRLPDAG